jgi:hypothetical protein
MKTLATLVSTAFGLVSILAYSNQTSRISSNLILDNANLKIEVIDLAPPTCNGGSNGYVTIEVKGGTAPYSYNWNTFPNQYQEKATNLSPGVYFVDVTDSEGNKSYKSIHIENPDASSLTDSKNQNLEDIDLTTTITSKNKTFYYSLNGIQVDSYKIVDLPVGVHKLVITDDKNCQVNQFIQVFELDGKNKSSEFNPKTEFVNNDGKKISVSKLIVPKETIAEYQTKIVLSKKD